MVRLNQVVALVKGKKTEVSTVQTEAYHLYQKPDMFAGFKKTYEPKDEEGDSYPGDEKRLQLRALEVLDDASKSLVSLFDVVEIQDESNCIARADIVVDGKVLLTSVPPTYLMFLERKLTDVCTLLSKLPVLDPTKEWSYSEDARCYRADVVKRTKTKKVTRYHEMSPETDLHPAQMDKDSEDIVEGFWSTVEFSGAITEELKHGLIERARKLKNAVIAAREEANSSEVTAKPKCGNAVFNYILNSK